MNKVIITFMGYICERITNSKKKEGNDWTDIVDGKSDVEAKTKGGPERETDHQHSSDGEENLFH